MTPRGRGSSRGSSRGSFKGRWENTPYAKGLFAGLKGKHTGDPGIGQAFWAQGWSVDPTWGLAKGMGWGAWCLDPAMGPGPALWGQGMAAQAYPTTMPALPTV